ncbi:MAG: hypothetical protein K5660_07300 [Paludibacteraceae bacterium]|nr:hypothetical protein [Paludibacteraceae bacterium]
MQALKTSSTFAPKLQRVKINRIDMAEQTTKQEKPNVLKEAISRTWEAAMRLKGSVVVNDATLFL